MPCKRCTTTDNMKKSNLFRISIMLLVISINVGCDQVSKSIVRQNLDYNQTVELIDQNLILTKVENTGAFLSLGDELSGPARSILLVLFPTLALLLALGVALFNTRLDKTMAFGLCCVVGGGIGNIFDRLYYGSVTDFVHIDLNLVQTGVFNMADVSIMAGTLLILVQAQLKKPN